MRGRSADDATDSRPFTPRMMISDEESIRMMVGDCFIHLDKDAAEEGIAATGKESRAEVKGLESEIKEIRGELGELKATLYAKFKDTIQLEE